VKITVSCPVVRTPRVLQAESLFDVPQAAESVRTWDVDLPLDAKSWNVGLVVGPSGSGKSTIARALWPGQIAAQSADWDPDKAIVDGFPEPMSIREVTGLLSSVGLGTVPSWLRPHRVLSTGEAFRADLARLLASGGDPVVCDEFTSTVDRQVGMVCATAVAKAVRQRDQKFVAVSCHTDIEPWLSPDWVYRTDAGEFTWRCLQPRPAIRLDIARIPPQAWRVFRDHHYLTASLPGGYMESWGGWVGDTCVAFGYVCRFPHPKVKNIVRCRRLVVLPDWQGLGIGSRMMDWLAARYTAQGQRFRSVAAHPAMVAHYRKSPDWHYAGKGFSALQVGPKSGMRAHQLDPRGLQLQAFEYRPPGTSKAISPGTPVSLRHART
jgi:energy-coupling factor transporter ATP-binding protein EcfA2